MVKRVYIGIFYTMYVLVYGIACIIFVYSVYMLVLYMVQCV